MTAAEVRTLVGQIRLQRMQDSITTEDAKNQLENIDWSNVTDSPGMTVSFMQNVVNETITAIDQGKL